MEEVTTSAGGEISQSIIDFLILNIPIFSRLRNDELRNVKKYFHLLELIPGDTVFEEGDNGDYVCFVVEGSLDVLKKSGKGESVAIATLNKGSSMGEMSVIDQLPRSATVKATTKATLLTLSQEKLNYILVEHSSVGVKIIKGIARLLSMNLRKTSTRLADYMLPLS
jgi:CRP-like cAMP-binding protein